MKRPRISQQQAFKAGYAAGRRGDPWTMGNVKPEKSPFYRGWNLGHRVTRHLRVYGYDRSDT